MPFLVLAFFLGGCFNLKQPRKETDFYTLEYNPPAVSDLKPLPFVIRIEPFSVAPVYNTDQIIYRDRSFTRNAYAYHKWRTNPGHLIVSLLRRDIKKSGLFKAVLSPESRFPSSHMLEGSLDEFFEWDREDNWEAVLSLSVALMAENEPAAGKKILFQKTYSIKETCRQKNPQSLAEAMSRAMKKISRAIIKDIYHYMTTGLEEPAD